ncbi:hypothetical protein ILYODFUR_031612, partial [Ilyodon furcidens]
RNSLGKETVSVAAGFSEQCSVAPPEGKALNSLCAGCVGSAEMLAALHFFVLTLSLLNGNNGHSPSSVLPLPVFTIYVDDLGEIPNAFIRLYDDFSLLSS